MYTKYLSCLAKILIIIRLEIFLFATGVLACLHDHKNWGKPQQNPKWVSLRVRNLPRWMDHKRNKGVNTNVIFSWEVPRSLEYLGNSSKCCHFQWYLYAGLDPYSYSSGVLNFLIAEDGCKERFRRNFVICSFVIIIIIIIILI